MAYDVHVFRGKNWWEGTDKPITEEEILAVAGAKRMVKYQTLIPKTELLSKSAGMICSRLITLSLD